MRRRLLVPVLLLLLPLAALAAWLAWGRGDGSSNAPAVGAPRDALLPDLVVPPPTDVMVATLAGGRRQIFFTTSVANVGAGPFELRATRAASSSGWDVRQRFAETGGGTSERRTEAALVFGGHGHDHWHVRLGVAYRLLALPGVGEVSSLAKAGYCFFDQSRLEPAAPDAVRYPSYPSSGCGGRASREVRMGLSVGWSDPYTWVLPDQRLDVTGVPSGTYRLEAVADPDGWFTELDEGNNAGWVDIRLGRRADGMPTLEVLRRSALPTP